MKFSIYTLGCKVNQYESQALEQVLLSRGYEEGNFDEACDMYIVNTCTVTAVSDKKSRNALRRARKLNPEAVIGVCGCYAQVKPEDMEKLDVDVVGGTGDRIDFIRRMEQFLMDRVPSSVIDNAFKRKEMEILAPGGLGDRTRAMLKVEDGCVNFCSYCIIPYARGAIRSLPIDTAVGQLRSLYAKGYKEAVVTGIEISSWGRDLPGKPKPEQLIAALCEAVPNMRIRLGSLEPRTIDDEFCSALEKYNNLCPQFHLSLQSGCDATLKRMNRKYDTERYLLSCRLLRSAFPDCAITTDLITGFPGETEEEFSQTLAFLLKAGFSQMHIFPYSRREGTPAAVMPDQIPQTEKEARAGRAKAVADEMMHAFRSSFVGKTLPVLFEQTNEKGNWTGHTMNYIPVEVPFDGNLHNQILNVALDEVVESGILGHLVENEF